MGNAKVGNKKLYLDDLCYGKFENAFQFQYYARYKYAYSTPQMEGIRCRKISHGE